MDNIKFFGYSADVTFKKALKNRENSLKLESFYNAVNQVSSNCCSCCKRENIMFALQPVGIPQIKTAVLSICTECLRSLPVELTVINIGSLGAPPLLVDKIYSEV